MARNLSRRRVLTHKDFMSYGAPPAAKPTKPRERRRRRWSPLPVQKPSTVVDPQGIYACPDGAGCCDPGCITENRRRGVLPKK